MQVVEELERSDRCAAWSLDSPVIWCPHLKPQDDNGLCLVQCREKTTRSLEQLKVDAEHFVYVQFLTIIT